MTRPTADELHDVWHIDDVISTCPYCDEDMARNVLDIIDDNFDASVGVNWDVIESTAQEEYSGAYAEYIAALSKW